MARHGASTQQLRLKFPPELVERLETFSQQNGLSPIEFAQVLLEEGLRMEAHPGIVFRPGPAGRRPALACGPDIWEIARILREFLPRTDEAIQQAAELMALPPSEVAVALGYYVAFRGEVDEWLRRLDEEADQAEKAWRRQQGLPVA